MTGERPITKSQFKLGLNCILKLRHARPRPAAGRLHRYPNASDDNDMLRLLAEGGGAVEALWRCREPGDEAPKFKSPQDGTGKPAESPVGASFRLIANAIARSRSERARISLYEPTVELDGFSARIDLLRVYPDRLEVLEMKAKSVESADAAAQLMSPPTRRNPVPSVRPEWVPYVQDLAFQRTLLQLWVAAHHQQLRVTADMPAVPGLILVNKLACADAQDVLRNFHTEYLRSPTGWRPTVRYAGSGGASSALLVEMQGVPEVVQLIDADARAKDPMFAGMGITECMATMRKALTSDGWPDPRERKGLHCKKCEFRTKTASPSGFDECWGHDARSTEHHVLTLYAANPQHVQSAMAKAEPEGRQPTVIDVRSDLLEAKSGKDDGTDTLIRKLQYTCLTPLRVGGTPVAMVRPDFLCERARNTAMRRGMPSDPCYFLDFECGAYPIPQRVGGHPYEYVPFQFEGHVLPSFDAPLDARVRLDGFLDLVSDDPALEFVRQLQRQLGSHGVIYHWHHYERTVLDKIRESLRTGGTGAGAPDREELIRFIDSLIGEGKDGSGRFCDLLRIANRAFYDPELRGSFSIKRVLPVVWKVDAIRRHFRKGHHATGDGAFYGEETGNGGTDDPYDSLEGFPSEFFDRLAGEGGRKELEERMESEDESLPRMIKDGGMAMLYYHYVRLRGLGHQPSLRQPFRDYCGLDSAAMVMVFRYMSQEVPGFAKA